jgi:hypothetical protein
MWSNESNETHQLKVELEVTKVNLRHAETTVTQLRYDLDQLRATSISKDNEITRKDNEIKHKDGEFNRLNTTFEVTKEKLKQTETALTQKNQITKKKNRSLRLQAFLSSVLYLLATILTSIGINMITSAQSNSLGVTMIVLGVVTYLIGTAITIWITIEGSE